MPTKDEIVTSTAKMLSNRYDKNHNVTIQTVVEKHLKEAFQFRRYLCRKTAKSLCDFLEEKGIFCPYEINNGPIKRTWSIDFKELDQFLEKRE